jgi:nitrite reductase [NAD(P)H] large subunit
LEANGKESAAARLVVVGNGMAGVAVVEELLTVYVSGDAGPSGQAGQIMAPGRKPSITIFGDEPHVNYNRILLSELLAGRRPAESIYLNRRDWYAEQGIDLRMGVKIAAIDPARQCVIDAAGTVTAYDRLVIAVGAAPFVPPIAGVDKNGVFVFRTIHDSETIASRARKCRNAVVIGGGLLGLEAARALLHYGVAVTVVHLMDRLMEQQLDAIGGAMLKREIERLGIAVRLNSATAELCGEDDVDAVRLTSDERLPAELVVICAGIRPDLGLARAAGLTTNRGIIVDDQLRTSVPEIYAVGDVIEHRGRCYGLVAPLREQAQIAARAIARDCAELPGPPPVYEGTLCMTALKVAGVHLTSAGRFMGGAGCEELVAADTFASTYRKLVFEGGRLVGMILLGDTRDGGRLFGLIQSGSDVASMKEQLMGVRAASQAAANGLATPSALTDTELVCNCHGVTRGTIVTAIRDKGLKHRDEIARCTKASTGCGSCAQQVDDLLLETLRTAPALLKSGPQPVTSKAGAAQPAQNTPPPMAKPLTGYPLAYPRALEVERIKREGLGLDFDKIHERGVLALTEDDFYRLKTYGVCSQKHPGYFMVRLRIPGGRVTARQLLALADLAETHGRGWGHLTTRQNLELHWVRLEEILAIWARLEAVGLSTRSACGHTMRNVMACPHGPISPEALIDAGPWAAAISDYFVKRSDLINPAMPNRLNIYFAGCPDCATHAQINDIGFAAVKRQRMGTDLKSVPIPHEIGFELWVGGSLGAHPMLGFKLREFLTPEEVLPACQAIFEIHTHYGNRNKAKSRLKWLIDQWGIEKFSTIFDQRFEAKRTLPENRSLRLPSADDGASRPFSGKRLRAAVMRPFTGALPPGCLPQRQRGYVRMAVAVPLGEIRAAQLTALAGIVRRYGNGEAYLTKDQDVELHWIEARWARRAARALARAGLSPREHRTDLRVVACPGTEFCVLAVTNAQGAARELLKRIRPREAGAAELLRGVSIAVSGCPNSCAKHQIADIGLAGTMTTLGPPGSEERRYSYLLYLGGRLEGTVRLGEVVRKGITEEMVASTVEALLKVVAGLRSPGESFQQAVDRAGVGRIGELLAERLSPLSSTVAEKVSMIPELAEVDA